MTSDKSFASVIRVNIALLRLCGVIETLPSTENRKSGPFVDSRSNSLKNAVLGATAYSCLFVYSILYIREFVLYDIHRDTWTQSFTMTLSLVAGQARFTLLLLFRDRLRRLLTICEGLWLASSAAEKRCVRDYVRATIRLTYYYLFGCAFTIFFYAIASLFVSQRDSTNATTRSLPYASPIPFHRTPYYEIAYAMQLFSMTSVGLTCVATDTIGPVLTLTVSGHFKVLGSRILNLRVRDCGAQSAAISAQSHGRIMREHGDASRYRAKSDFEACVRYHYIVLEFCKELERLTTGMFLTQLLGSTYNIALVGFKLVGDDPDKFKYTTQLSIAVIQLFLCNWPAHVLLTESEGIARAMYFTPWYHFPYQLKRSLSIVTIRSQKPAQLTAGYFVSLSLQTFASMVSSAASFFTMMRSMN